MSGAARGPGAGGHVPDVAFEATLAELSAASLRAYRASRLYRRVHWTFGIATALALGTMMGLRTAAAASRVTAIGVGVLAAVVSLLLYDYTGRWALRRSFAARWRPQLQGRETLRVEVGLTDTGVLLRRGAQETTHRWATMAAAQAVRAGVELRSVTGPITVIPDRAFADGAARTQFLQAVDQRAGAHTAAVRG